MQDKSDSNISSPSSTSSTVKDESQSTVEEVITMSPGEQSLTMSSTSTSSSSKKDPLMNEENDDYIDHHETFSNQNTIKEMEIQNKGCFQNNEPEQQLQQKSLMKTSSNNIDANNNNNNNSNNSETNNNINENNNNNDNNNNNSSGSQLNSEMKNHQIGHYLSSTKIMATEVDTQCNNNIKLPGSSTIVKTLKEDINTNNDNDNDDNGNKSISKPSTLSDNGNYEEDVTDYYYNKLPHWSQNIAIYESVSINDCLISGGSDNGQMPYFTQTGEIIIEIDGQQVAGLTSTDIEQILRRSLKHTFKVLTGAHGLPLELREYLSRRFARGSIDHKLQELIRDNIYARTLPITTRPIREGELDGVDYKFLTKEQFLELESCGLLLESGIYCNYYYGTPLPCIDIISNNSDDSDKNDSKNIDNNENVNDLSATINTLAKRKRNRSNIMAIDAASLPYGWERISDAHYGVYYIDHINKRTQYERPYEIELVKGISGFGFTLIEIDKGLIVVKLLIHGGSAEASGVIQPGDVLVSVAGVSISGFQHSDIAHLFSTFNVGDRVRLTFARGYQLPTNLLDDDYEIINLKITKGYYGFGFTISEGHNGQKVKKILDMERCWALRQGDILLSINGVDLTQMFHLDVVEMLKQCPCDEPTEFMVNRKKRSRSKIISPILQQQQQQQQKQISQHSPNIETNDTSFGNTLGTINRNCKTPIVVEQQFHQQPNLFKVNNNNIGYSDELSNINYDYDQHQSNQMATTTSISRYNSENYNLFNNQIDYNNFPSSNNNNVVLVNNGNHLKSQLIPTGAPRPQSSMGNQNLPFFGNVDIDYEYHQVTLNRMDTGFGFRIIGGSEDGSNIAIGSIVIGGSAHKDGTMKAGDELISINGTNVIGASHQEAVQLMSQTGTKVTIVVRRKRYLNAYDVTLHRQDYEGFGFVIISCGNCALIGRIIEGSPAHRCHRLHIRDRIIAVNGVDMTNMSHPEIVNKIKESDDTLHLRIVPADCYTCELIRGSNGYGFSIRGGAEFNGMPLFILCIAANGPASSLLQVGDEILEINERSTIGMTHQEAVQLISQSVPSVRLRLRHNYGEFFNNLCRMAPPSPRQLSPGQTSLAGASMSIPAPPPPPNSTNSTTS